MQELRVATSVVPSFVGFGGEPLLSGSTLILVGGALVSFVAVLVVLSYRQTSSDPDRHESHRRC